MKIHIINGPNLNLLGSREPHIYGSRTFDEYLGELRNTFQQHTLTYFQSNIEGDIINNIQSCNALYDALIINPGGYSHTSVAIADALAALTIPATEVHISHVLAREEFRRTLITASYCKGLISGFGLGSYKLAITALSQE